MRLYGIASAISNDVADLRSTYEEAAEVLKIVIEEAPELAAVLWVEPVDMPEPSLN